MEAALYYYLSIWFDFSIILSMAAWAIGLYNAFMLHDVSWLLWCGGATVGATILHWFALIFEDEAAYYATDAQYEKWFEAI